MFKTDDYAEVQATFWSALPQDLRKQGVKSSWADANRGGEPVDSFLEGPCFGPDGALLLVDIPFGRILRVGTKQEWSVVAQYDGWPNGLKVVPNHCALVADYRRGLVSVDLSSGVATPVLAHRFSEGFKGLNDLYIAPTGDVYFTDQGQTGLHDPSGRVYRLRADGQLDTLLTHVPSPNGLVLAKDGKSLFVAVTRDASVWRAAIMPDGNVGKVGRFVSFFGATGPDGMALDAQGRLWVAHPSGDCVWVVAASGEIARRVRFPSAAFPTNLALDTQGDFYMVASGTGAIYRVSSAI